MLSNIVFWEYLTAIVLVLIKPISSQGIACYKCMTTDPNNDACQDPFSSLLNPVQYNCQATFMGKNGTFPARFCVKISGRVTSVDDGANASYLDTVLYYRTCVVENIMESTKSLETSGNFRLKGLNSMPGSIRLRGYMALCTIDGCNHSRILYSSVLTIIIVVEQARSRNINDEAFEDFDTQDESVGIDDLRNQPAQPVPIPNDLLCGDGSINEISPIDTLPARSDKDQYT